MSGFEERFSGITTLDEHRNAVKSAVEFEFTVSARLCRMDEALFREAPHPS